MTEEKQGSVFDTVGSTLDALSSSKEEVHEMEIVEGASISVIGEQERAEIDMMIATAKRYPRTISKFVQQARSLALSTPQIAAGCSYAVPRKGKTITGPSIRLAEIVAPSWGNCRYGGRVTDIGDRFVTVQGFFYDLENNVGVSVDVRRRITDKHGNRYNDDMIQQTCQAGVSIAVRNAIFRGIPGGYVEAIRLEAEEIALGKKDGLTTQVEKALGYFTEEYGIKKEAILRTLQVENEKDITWGHVSRLIAFRTSIQTGESTADQIFADDPELEKKAPPKAGRQTRKSGSSEKPSKPKTSPEADPEPKVEEKATEAAPEPSEEKKDGLGI